MKFAAIITVATSVPQLLVSDVREIDGTNCGIGGHAHARLNRVCEERYPGDGSGSEMYNDNNLPNVRTISNIVCKQTENVPNKNHMSDMVWAWGQFLDHDISLTEGAKEFGTADIVIEDPNDSLYSQGPMMFSRSEYDLTTGAAGNPRQQVNLITSYIDASNVYGSDQERSLALRTLQGGRLETSAGDLLPMNLEGLSNAGGPGADMFLCGDVRCNEHVGLMAMHTLFVREHNRLAVIIADMFHCTDDDLIYEMARKIVAAEMQIITYKEFLPALLGDRAPKLGEYQGWVTSVDAGIMNEFSTAIFRFGHTMLSTDLVMADADGVVGSTPLAEAFFNPAFLTQNPAHVDMLLNGFHHQKAQEIDVKIIESVRSLLFANAPPGHAFDLGARNLQRGRDHGIPPYNVVRRDFGLAEAATFSDITSNPKRAADLELAYKGDVEMVDVWLGALAEDHLEGAACGELIATVVAKQFRNLMHGDRFFYLNDPDLEPSKIQSIIDLSTLSLSDVLAWNTAYKNQPQKVFKLN